MLLRPSWSHLDAPILQATSKASNPIQELYREMGEDNQEVLEGQWHLREFIHQALFHYGWWEVQVRKVLAAIGTLHQTQRRGWSSYMVSSGALHS